MFKSTFGALLVALAVNSTPVSAGGISSNGGNSLLDTHNPWFVGSDPVHYCLEIDPNFSVGREVLQGIVRESIRDWVETVQALRGDQRETIYVFPDGMKRSIATQFVENEHCTANTTLKFAFGTQPNATWNNEDQKISAAIRTELDKENGRPRQGIVWISPDRGMDRVNQLCEGYWSFSGSSTLANVVMHELGHVFGFTHDSLSFVHFMEEEAPAQMMYHLSSQCWNPSSTPGLRVSSNIYTSRNYFFNGRRHNGWVSWGDSEEVPGSALLGFSANDRCTDVETGLQAGVQTKIAPNFAYLNGGLLQDAPAFERLAYRVDLMFSKCDGRIQRHVSFVPDHLLRAMESELVKAKYTPMHLNPDLGGDGRFVYVVDEYLVSGSLVLEDGKRIQALVNVGVRAPGFMDMTLFDHDQFYSLRIGQMIGSPW